MANVDDQNINPITVVESTPLHLQSHCIGEWQARHSPISTVLTVLGIPQVSFMKLINFTFIKLNEAK